MNILWSSDFDIRGSGYQSICANICKRLVEQGHSAVVLGADYHYEPHRYPFTLIPSDFKLMRSQVETIKQAQWPDVLVFSWDIPAQRQLTEWFAGKGTALYVGVFPVEAGPLKEIEDWVGYIKTMDMPLCISEFGTAECHDAGLTNTRFLPVGIDSDFFQPPTPEYREDLRRDLNLTDKFTIVSVGDNHFRKGHALAFETVAKLIKDVPEAHYIIIARPHSRSIGWSMKELAYRFGIEKHITIIHSRPSDEMLLRFYQASDAFLNTSHAEGLGLPLLEAMACKVPCVAGNWTAMPELLRDGRGILIDPAVHFIDPFGNQDRYFIDISKAADALAKLATDSKLRECITAKALPFAQSRNYDAATEVFLNSVSAVG